ncbi:MAG: DUF1579 domain-containing protein [Planctomycetes bacterium]|nr:DUF1579 domain-containing protein [Planctomycetota bacterium]
MPNPKTPQHERLAAFAGTWRTETKMAAMPGVPGMEAASEMVGVERAELVCNGLWLKVAGDGTYQGQACSGLWLLGYDSIAKTYQCLAASNMDDAPCCVDGRHDEATKVWHFHGNSPMGPFRSELVFETPDRSVEVGFTKRDDGKETEFLRIVRTRVTGAAAASAGTAPAETVASETVPSETKKLAPPLAAMHADFGTWDADFTMEMPGAPPMQSKCREVVGPVCGGKWSWSTFTGAMMGAPFEGHCLVGFDAKTEQMVSFWIDSMSGAWMRTDGAYDAGKRTCTMSGTCYDQQGQRQKVASTATSVGKDARTLRTVFGEGAGQSVMTIVYRRAGK